MVAEALLWQVAAAAAAAALDIGSGAGCLSPASNLLKMLCGAACGAAVAAAVAVAAAYGRHADAGSAVGRLCIADADAAVTKYN